MKENRYMGRLFKSHFKSVSFGSIETKLFRRENKNHDSAVVETTVTVNFNFLYPNVSLMRRITAKRKAQINSE